MAIIKKYPVRRLKIDRISDQPGRFCMSYGFDSTGLEKSLAQVGLINNPFIFICDDNGVETVTGFRRIQALRKLNVKTIDCYDLTDSGMPHYEMLRLAFHDNMFTRELNLVEKSMFFNRLTKLVKDNNLIRKYIDCLNVSLKDYEVILGIEKLDNSLKDSVSGGNINIKALERLIQLDINDAVLLNDWISKLKLNYNYQIQFIDYIIDISRIHKLSVSSVLGDEYYLNLLENRNENTPQKARELIDSLRTRRNPNLSKYQNIFEKKVKQLQLPKNIKIKNPGNFESEGYQLEIDFKNGVELWENLKRLVDRNELKNLGDPWEDD